MWGPIPKLFVYNLSVAKSLPLLQQFISVRREACISAKMCLAKSLLATRAGGSLNQIVKGPFAVSWPSQLGE